MTTLAPTGSRGLPSFAVSFDKHRVAILVLIAVTAVALLAPVLAPSNPTIPVDQPFLPPFSLSHLLGTDSVGRDELSRVLFGVRSSWISAIAVICFGVLVGGTVGMIAGVSSARVDSALMRITDGS